MSAPRLSVDAVLALRDRLAAALAAAQAGGLVDAAEAILPPSCRGLGSVERTLRPLLDRPLTAESAALFAHRLAGNLPRLAEGRHVPPWKGQPFDEFCDVQLLELLPPVDRGGKPGRGVRLKAQTGLPAGLIFVVVWSPRLFPLLARRAGFDRTSDRGRTPARHPYADPLQLVNFRFRARVPKGDGFWATDLDPRPHADHNRALLRLRLRVDPSYTCPRGLPASFPCHHCPVGADECGAGVHPRTYVQGPCARCGRPAAFFDPTDTEVCVECRRSRKKG